MKDIRKHINEMTWGFSGLKAERETVLRGVGPGWTKLINTLIDDLFLLGWDGVVFQVKEKFGGLRFYIGGATPEIFDRIAIAEEQSYYTCEECGKSGKLYPLGWHRTLCPEHAQEQYGEDVELQIKNMVNGPDAYF